MSTFDLHFMNDPKITRKRLATDPELRGVRIVLGRPLPSVESEALTRDLEVSFVGG